MTSNLVAAAAQAERRPEATLFEQAEQDDVTVGAKSVERAHDHAFGRHGNAGQAAWPELEPTGL